jgi:hypothetical protein
MPRYLFFPKLNHIDKTVNCVERMSEICLQSQAMKRYVQEYSTLSLSRHIHTNSIIKTPILVSMRWNMKFGLVFVSCNTA